MVRLVVASGALLQNSLRADEPSLIIRLTSYDARVNVRLDDDPVDAMIPLLEWRTTSFGVAQKIKG